MFKDAIHIYLTCDQQYFCLIHTQICIQDTIHAYMAWQVISRVSRINGNLSMTCQMWKVRQLKLMVDNDAVDHLLRHIVVNGSKRLSVTLHSA